MAVSFVSEIPADHGSFNPEWWIAVALTLVGTTLTASGLMIQKYSHREDLKTQTGGERASCYFLSRCWLLGMGVFIIGHLVCWMGLAIGAQVVLSCLNVWSMVVTFMVAPVLLNETVSVAKVGSVLIIIFGAVVVIIFGPKSYRPYTTESFVDNLHNPVFLTFSACVFASLMLLWLKASFTADRPRLPSAQCTLASAMIGWYSVLSAKCVAGLLFTLLSHREIRVVLWIACVVLLAMVIFAVLNVHLMNVALKHGDAVLVVPMYESLSILGQVFLGGIFFNEFDELTGRNQVCFWLGVGCVILGIVCMTGPARDSDVSCESGSSIMTRLWRPSAAAADDARQAPLTGSRMPQGYSAA